MSGVLVTTPPSALKRSVDRQVALALGALPATTRGALVGVATRSGVNLAVATRVGDRWTIQAYLGKRWDGPLEGGAIVERTW